jgi:hypothetical protein
MGASYSKTDVTIELLNQEPASYFVYGDNISRQKADGSASLRRHPRTVGFVVEKEPAAKPSKYFKTEEYVKLFFDQLRQLTDIVKKDRGKKYYISQLGAESSNKFYIWERLIKHSLEAELGEFDNVVFCWEQN